MDVTFGLFDYYMNKESIRSYICRTIADDDSIQKTVMLDSRTYLDDIDLSFRIRTHIIHDNQNRYFIIGLGDEDPSIFEYFQKKIMIQIAKFNAEAKVCGVYFNMLPLRSKDIES